MEIDGLLCDRLAFALRLGVIGSLILMIVGLTLSIAANAQSPWVIRAGIVAVLGLPVLQGAIAFVSFYRAGNRRLAAVVLALMAVQFSAVLVAFA